MNLYRYPGETQILTDEIRATTSGKYVPLSQGITHYELAGPEDAPTVVLIHGFSVPYPIWDPVFIALIAEGFRVLRYDLFGRGTSDRPKVAYDHDLFDRQLVELLDVLELGSGLDLMGLSMGGSILAVFCDRHPEWVRRMVFIDPAGFQVNSMIWVRLLTLPLLGELAFSLMGEKVLMASVTKEYSDTDRYPEYIDIVREQMRFVGYRQALLSTIRGGVLGDISNTYHRIGKQDRPASLIWGTKDQLVPFELSEKVCQAIPHIEFHPIHGAGHVPHYEKPHVVNPLIIDFLQRLA